MKLIQKGGNRMGVLLGYLCLIFFCLLSAKAITAKLHLQKMDKALMKIHKLASGFLVISCFLHILFVIPVLKNRNLFIMISGVSIVLLMILLIYLCHTIKEQKKKMWWHRTLTVLMAICMIGHFCTLKFLFIMSEIH